MRHRARRSRIGRTVAYSASGTRERQSVSKSVARPRRKSRGLGTKIDPSKSNQQMVRHRAIQPICSPSPKASGPHDNLVGPAMDEEDPWRERVRSNLRWFSEPTSRSAKRILTPSCAAAALRPSLIRDGNPTWLAWSTVAAQPSPPLPLFSLPPIHPRSRSSPCVCMCIHAPCIPVPTRPKLDLHNSHNPRVAASGPPAPGRCWLHAKKRRQMQRA